MRSSITKIILNGVELPQIEEEQMLSQEILRKLKQAEKANSLKMALDLYGVTREQYLDAKESMEMENELK